MTEFVTAIVADLRRGRATWRGHVVFDSLALRIAITLAIIRA